NEVVGVTGFLYPGSHVDVLATFRPEGNASPLTQTILQNVQVITAGQRSQPDAQGKPEAVNVITLLLDPVDSEKLILASTQATIQFVLRNGGDTATSVTHPVSADGMMGGNPAKTVPEACQQVTAPPVQHRRH